MQIAPSDNLMGRWWLVHTKSRNEKALAADLDRRQIDYFLPLVRPSQRSGGHAASIEIPLFPGYLCLRGGDEQRYLTLTTHRAAAVFDVFDQERLAAELATLHRALTSLESIDLYPGIRKGRRCLIRSGHLRGVEGVVIRRRGLCRVFLAIGILGQSAELEIDPALLDLIG